MAENNKSLTSFWKRPEGKPGMLVMAALIGIGGFALYKAAPAIITLMENMYYMIGMGIGLFTIITLLMNKKFTSTVWYLYKGLMRAFTGMVIELNPIAILRSYVEDIKEKLGKMSQQIIELGGQLGKIDKKIASRKEEQKKQIGLANQAKKMPGREAEVKLHAMQAMRLEEYISKLEALSAKMNILLKVLNKMKYYSEIMIKNTEMEVEIKTEEREAITKSHSVMKSALNIIQGNDDKRMIFDQAMEFVVDDIGFKVGEMDRMLEASTDFINSVDLENALYEENGMKMLEEFDKKGMDTIFGTKKALNVGSENYAILNKFNTPEPVEITKSSSSNGTENKKYF